MKETDMYGPIKSLLTAQGFVVKGEVKGCDIAALKDETLWIVEMKLQFNMTLLYQAMERLKMTNQVFVAIPRPRRANDKNYRLAQRIIKKLELGLITVALDSPSQMAEIVIFPGEKVKKINTAARAMRKEVEGRTGDTAGGGVKTTINTAYRERCIRIACLLSHNGALSARALVHTYGCEKDAYRIMRSNHYNWFRREDGAKFSLTEIGGNYLMEHAADSIVAYYKMKAEEETDET